MDLLEPPSDALYASAASGELFVWQPVAGVVVYRVRGILSLPLARWFQDFLEPLLESGIRVSVFGDFELMTQYTREARESLTGFAVEHISQLENIHLFTSSKFVALGIGAVKHAIGDQRVHAYTNRGSFRFSLAKAIGEHGGTLDSGHPAEP